ncbi:MAG: CPBP family intramembrane metalloprotease [Candidatus Dadabacteria bacterium]|nr:CPBP family intramembrane metalloprotease [Candidatus Dadabacteria bacterium]
MGNKLRFKPLGFLEHSLSFIHKFTKDASKDTVNSILLYVIITLIITLLRRFLPDYALPIAALLFFSAPYLMKSKVTGLKWNLYGLLLGIVVSVVILSIYVVVVNKPLQFSRVSYDLFISEFFLVALPEEVFFRSYLQEKIGNNLRGVLIVSLLFAIAHFVVICVGGGYSGVGCLKTLLTFFPSIIMGFMYARSGTLWGSITFHYLSNVIFKATGGL